MANNTDYPNQLHAALTEMQTDEESKLFDYQRNVFNFMTKMNQRGILLYHSVGSGKCMAAGTMILMADGSQREIQNIKVGDSIMGDDSEPRVIQSLASGDDQMYNIWYGNNRYTVNSDHVLCLKTETYPYCWETPKEKVVQFLEQGRVMTKIFKKEDDVSEFMKQCLEKIIHVTVKDFILAPDLVSNARGYKVKVNFKSTLVSSPSAIGAISARGGTPLPREYTVNDFSVREKVVAGILNNKGRIFKRDKYDSYIIKFEKGHKKLMNQLIFILGTLGILYSVKLLPNGNYRIIIYGKDLVSIHRHTRWASIDFNPGPESIEDGYKISVKPAGFGRYYGFSINGNRRYLLSDCTVTHNTMTSVSIAEHFKSTGRDILVLSSKALQINYKKEINKFRGTEGEDFENYSFITSNARNMISKITNESKNSIDEMINHASKKSLDNKVIIIDEAHNLFNSIVNGSEIANEFYDMVLNAKNIKLILMTGTPCINDPFELSICYNMIVGNMSKGKTKTTILPEYYTDFVKYFVAPNRSGIINEDKLRNRIFGLTSYYGDFYTTEVNISKQLKKTESKENYPDRFPIKFEVVKMSEVQSMHYLKARETEKLENSIRGSGVVKEASMSSTSYRIKSRQMSNVYIPDQEDQEPISKYSSKISKIIENVSAALSEPGTMLIYSTFLKYGVEAITKELEKIGVTDGAKTGEGKKYMIFSGQQSQEEKEAILSTFNSEANKNGDLIKIIMITKSGTEGLDLKNVRHLHITEPYWNFSLIQQVIARGVRYKSHNSLEEHLRNVQVYIYLSDYNENALAEMKERKAEIEQTTDIYMITNAIKNQELIYKFLKIIASTSIECKYYNKGINYDCYTCKPTNEKLYVEDIHTDMLTSNKCIKTKQVTAHEIIIDGMQYFYTDLFDVYKKVEDGIYVKVEDEDIVSQVKRSVE